MDKPYEDIKDIQFLYKPSCDLYQCFQHISMALLNKCADTKTCSDRYEEKDDPAPEEAVEPSDMEYLEADPSLLPDSSEYETIEIRRKTL